jgi:hypothetical protein
MNSRDVKENGLLFIDIGWIPILLNGKVPFRPGWQRTTRESAEKTFEKVKGSHNIGIVTGESSGIIVIDVEKDDLKDWDDLVSLHGGLPKTLTVKTGGGGIHVYFKYSPELSTIRNGVKIKLPLGDEKKASVDIRTTGGQVVAIGSIHPDTGEKYTPIEGWGEMGEDISIDIADMPGWLADLIRSEQSKIGRGRRS